MVHRAAASDSRLLVATMRGVAVLDRDRPTDGWQLTRVSLPDRHVSALLFEPSRGGVFAATHGNGIFFSADRGETWAPASRGLTLQNVFSLNYSVVDGTLTLLAGTEPVMLFSSRDYGSTWDAHDAIARIPGRDKWTFPAPPHVAHLKSIAIHPAQPQLYYACIEQGALLRTTDAGDTWHELAGYARADDEWYRDIHKIVPSYSDPRRLLMSSGVGVYRSDDAGTTWTKLTGAEFKIGYPDHLIVSPRDEETIFVSGAATSPNIWRETHAARAVVMRSSDGGRHWQLASSGLPQNGRAAIEGMSIEIGLHRSTLFLGNTDGEVYESDDEATTWNKIASGLAPVSKAMHANNLA